MMQGTGFCSDVDFSNTSGAGHRHGTRSTKAMSQAAFAAGSSSKVLLLPIVPTRQRVGVFGSVDGGQIMPQCFGVWAGCRFGIHIFVFLDNRAVEGQSRIGT